ncbi:hypothetical protein MPER_07971, partial [Moniliophthora perniciosa FA553]
MGSEPDVAPVPIVEVNDSTKPGDNGMRRRNVGATEASNTPIEANKDRTHSREPSMAVCHDKGTQKTIFGAMAFK